MDITKQEGVDYIDTFSQNCKTCHSKVHNRLAIKHMDGLSQKGM